MSSTSTNIGLNLKVYLPLLIFCAILLSLMAVNLILKAINKYKKRAVKITKGMPDSNIILNTIAINTNTISAAI
ncbi:MAG: hypothetical protein L6U99_03475 [Clostridium sp.]|nr:MAG: hypothetical protein L6U99_03475 [Clostridium sp.]